MMLYDVAINDEYLWDYVVDVVRCVYFRSYAPALILGAYAPVFILGAMLQR